MKKSLKLALLTTFALATQNQIWGNLIFEQPLWTIIKVSLILTIFEILLKPLLRILLLPINIITLGLFRIVINTLGFYLAIFLLSDFRVNIIDIPAQVWQGIALPKLYFYGFWSFVVNSTTQNFLLYIFRTIIKPIKEKK